MHGTQRWDEGEGWQVTWVLPVTYAAFYRPTNAVETDEDY